MTDHSDGAKIFSVTPAESPSQADHHENDELAIIWIRLLCKKKKSCHGLAWLLLTTPQNPFVPRNIEVQKLGSSVMTENFGQ